MISLGNFFETIRRNNSSQVNIRYGDNSQIKFDFELSMHSSSFNVNDSFSISSLDSNLVKPLRVRSPPVNVRNLSRKNLDIFIQSLLRKLRAPLCSVLST